MALNSRRKANIAPMKSITRIKLPGDKSTIIKPSSRNDKNKFTPRKAPAKKTKALKKKGKGVEKNVEHASKAGEDIARTEVVSRKVQRQVAKEKSRGDKAKECSGPFQCSVDECQDSWVKVPGWERKVKILNWTF